MIFKNFHPVVAQWFQDEFESPTEIQQKAWPEIKARKNVLISAPTGSGKTLAAFFAAIDNLVQQGIEGTLLPETQIVYISPLKALSNDIERNLQIPLKGIKKQLKESGLPESKIKVMVRTGDTPPSERTAMTKSPPHILVTTPESLYLLLTSKNGRIMLSTVHTTIVDEIHALVGNKRGSHLSLSLERLENLTKNKLVRIGLSATQKPIEMVADFLVGKQQITSNCKIIDAGHKRKLDLQLEIPRSPITAVMPNEVWGELYDRFEELIEQHQTTLIFVNTRRLAERMTHNLSERIGSESITAHHGSMSKEHRFEAEQKLKEGKLKCLVATASLELGIDIGSIDLVCQIGSPKSIAAFLQRVGRSGHTIKGIPKGRLFPLSRDELVECTAIMDAVRRGELDSIVMPEKPLDILAQQIVAEVACRDYSEDELFQLFSQAYPYQHLSRKEFDDVVNMLAEGYTSRRGRRGAYLHHDKVNSRVKARKGARLTALVSGGAIPDNFDYDVILEPENVFIGTLNEDFAVESIPGDIFQLGNNSWRLLKIENGRVRVEDAKGLAPTIPFWLGEAPGRTIELSKAVSRLREEVSERLGNLENLKHPNEYLDDETPDESWKFDAIKWLTDEVKITEEAADQLVAYLATAKAALGVIPSQNKLVLERFFDEVGDMHVVLHSPFGSQMNRAWGLSLRKRFCRKFNFELQAAANEDAIVLSLGATHSFPLDEVFHYLNSKTVEDVLIQALLDAPMFEIRWRWNASRALAVLRRRAGQKVPPQIQRMNSEDLIALVFPDQIACLENIVGEREIPDHPLINQTIHDCLTEAMNIDLLKEILQKIDKKEIKCVSKDLTEPSVLAQEIVNARPYAFLDDNTEFAERRTNAVQNRRWLDPAEAKDLGKLDIEAIKKVKAEAWPQAETADELHDALVLSGFFTEEEGMANNWQFLFEELITENRAVRVVNNWQLVRKDSRRSSSDSLGAVDKKPKPLWVAAERIPFFKKIHPKSHLSPEIQIPKRIFEDIPDEQNPLVEIVRGRLETLGPVQAIEIAESIKLPEDEIDKALLALENEGFVFRGNFTPDLDVTEWCERRLLARIHRYTIQKLRKEIEPVSSADFMRFLFDWQHAIPELRTQGPASLEKIVEQLEGFEAQAAAWESDILPARIKDYEHIWLDMLCLSGKIVWGKNNGSKSNGSLNGKKPSPIKTTPITLMSRSNKLIISKISEVPNGIFSENARKVLEFLQKNGASFFGEILTRTGLMEIQVEQAMSELVSLGLLTSDSYTGLRAMLVPIKYKAGRKKGKAPFSLEQAGRWSVTENAVHTNMQKNGSMENGTQKSSSEKKASQQNRGWGLKEDDKVRNETIARILLKRYGVVFRKVVDRENIALPWRELVRVFRLMEARGEIRGGRFVTGVWGEQFALPEALSLLRKVRKTEKGGQLVSISAADPLNLTGIITPEKRISQIYSNRILYRDGIPIAVKEGKEIRFLIKTDSKAKWKLKSVLIQRNISPKLRAYLGKGIL
ncbi:DEAD/DEAH box helicase [Bacteroidales bacterium AH-315-I05]|nr:DEAD/DEAH box helicase [Bacteroidales bacterium AH-315-I05]